MRPERSIVKKAIQDTGGNLARSAALLGCTRQTLYTWIYQHGLQRLAGIRLDRQAGLNSKECKDTETTEERKSGVKSAAANRPMLSLVETQVADVPVQATVRVRESLWKLVKIEAIRRDLTLGALVEQALESFVGERKSRAAGKTTDK